MQTTDYEEKGNPQQYEGSGRRQSSMGFANNASATSNTNFNNVRRYSTAYISSSYHSANILRMEQEISRMRRTINLLISVGMVFCICWMPLNILNTVS